MNGTKIFSSFAKRLLAAFIVLTLAVGLVPVTAYVENEVQGGANLAYAGDGPAYYEYDAQMSKQAIYDRLNSVFEPALEIVTFHVFDADNNETDLSYVHDLTADFPIHNCGESKYTLDWSWTGTGTLYLQEKVTTKVIENPNTYATYDGQEHKWVPEVTAAVNPDFSTSDYNVTYYRGNEKTPTTDLTSAGNIRVEIKGVGNYSYYTYVGRYTILPASITVDVAGKSDTVTYNGKEQSVLGYEVTNTGSSLYTADKIALKDGVTVEAKGTDAGTYETALSADDLVNTDSNFDVTFNVTNGTLTIEQCAIEVKDTSSVVYNGKEQVLNIEASKATGLVKGHELTLENAQIKGTEVGSYDKVSEYTWKVMDGDIDVSKNYTINVSGKLTITKETPVTPQTGDSTMLCVGVALGVAAIAAALVAFLATRKLRGSTRR